MLIQQTDYSYSQIHFPDMKAGHGHKMRHGQHGVTVKRWRDSTHLYRVKRMEARKKGWQEGTVR